MWKAFNNLRGAGNMKKVLRIIVAALVIILVLYFFLFFLQTYWAHRDGTFVPDYQRLPLNENVDYETVFLQTGLGKSAVNKLLKSEGLQGLLNIQERFWKKDKVSCDPVFGLFSRVDRIKESRGTPLVDLQPGDILITMSTHSAGWYHGHVGLVLDEENVLECVKIGEESEIVNVEHWENYSNYVVLRVKGVSSEMQQEVTTYAKDNLCGVPYQLMVGVFGNKSVSTDSRFFGTQCAHSVWYVWRQFGYDLDSDGGNLVTPYDLMCSERLEVVQVYGMDPRNFLCVTGK